MTGALQTNTLLPDSETNPFTRSLAAGAGASLDDGLRQALSPATAPAELLSHLAVHEAVALWFDDWDEATKRLAIAQSLRMRSLIGTLPALREFLALVGAEIIDRQAYPARFIFGRSRIGYDPILIRPFRGRYLIKTNLAGRQRALRFGKSTLNNKFVLRPPSREPIRRATAAAVASKVPATQYLLDFGHRRRAAFADLPTFADWTSFNRTFVDRNKLRQNT